ncbi:hypothetical protein GZ77_12835 [Endozoicomonas montiporae]|uniref:Uncharacterized protein n=2 Tax=Endozoicomonas montiporae TaxID=1027273 RepID=A0A081N0D7_9GAMM|nr:SctK family type III secretion system sorting platform protein [Endozoicomonas montiporae]AMO57844.1 type III secretion protein K [Endozoicomonas montiporae CL-33]KEQ11910.1 hypothetical protein GZ77_22620 [Endozoicomonas montiporae]KEQ13310.1 hypothetical protein GZ77_12835 [Endozoicomonas montiporae]
MTTSHPLIDGRQSLDLFQRVAEFNLYLVRYIDSTWLTTVKLSPLVSQLRKAGNADFYLSHYLLTQFSLQEDYDYDFEQPAKRIVLATTDTVLKTATYIGIVLNEDVIRNAVRRKERVALEKCLGADAYRFAVKKAQFISRAASSQGPSLLIDWNHLQRFRQFLQTNGLQVIGKAFSQSPQSFRKRLELKLPQSCKASLSDTQALNLSETECVNLMVKAYREVDKEWRLLLS